MADDTNTRTMGEELTSVFKSLWEQSTQLHHRWQEYETLFGSGKGRLDILNANCSAFFGLVQRALWAETLLNLCRMTDPPKSVGKANLTLRRLPELLDCELREDFETAWEKVNQSVAFAREWRNRVLAHSDLDLTSEKPANPLAQADHKMVSDALEAIGECLNLIDHFYNDRTTYWKPIRPLTGAENLLYIVRAGNRAKDENIEAMGNGTYDWKSDDSYMTPLPE